MDEPIKGAEGKKITNRVTANVAHPEGEVKWHMMMFESNLSAVGRQSRRCHRCLMDLKAGDRVLLMVDEIVTYEDGSTNMSLQLVHSGC